MRVSSLKNGSCLRVALTGGDGTDTSPFYFGGNMLVFTIILVLISWFELIATIVAEQNIYLPLAMFTAGVVSGVGVIVCIGILIGV